ncbi:MAG: hypothetical protein HKN13_03415, partial [Rhodothermales bacterium]|nr:hypothetical protein [Rhodothermales bacterium]
PVPVNQFVGSFDVVDRVWVGEQFYANRLQDWRVRSGRLEAVEGRSTKPMRTVHLLTRSIGESGDDVTITVTTGPIAPDGTPSPATPDASDTWSGFLVGAGGRHVDYRISALVHHWPAEDGGLIVAVDGAGEIVVRDNGGEHGYKRPVRDIPTESWTRLVPSVPGDTIPPADRSRGVRITGRFVRSTNGFDLIVTVLNPDTGAELSSATFRDLAPNRVDGNIALVSHSSTSGAGPGYWFDDLAVSGGLVEVHEERRFGPVLGAFHTLSGSLLKMTAQFGPIGINDPNVARLEVRRGMTWESIAQSVIDPQSYTALFRVEDFSVAADVPYRIVYDNRTDLKDTETFYEGTIRRPPTDKETFVLAAMNCQNISGGDGQWNHNHFWYPHDELTTAVANHQPDMVFFAGDQIYEAGLAGIVRSPVDIAMLDYLNHWYRFVWAFRDLTRDIPAVIIPDDHDVYHGNVWGNNGVKNDGAFSPPTDAGGYLMPTEWINMMHRTQVAHLPDPVDPEPLSNGVSVYHTRMEYANLSFGIVADRAFKSPPKVLVPEARVWNGWPQRVGYDARDADVDGAVLLGERQLSFLDEWANDWSSQAWVKVLLSQTLFNNVATLPAGATSGAVLPGLSHPEPGEYPVGDVLASDMDSNGWPQSGRNKALKTIRKGFAFHIAGDQHLGSFVHYGVDEWGDAGNAFVVPSIANIWPRRWFPGEPGEGRNPYEPRYTGNYFDGFGNRMTVRAVANPVRSGREPAALYDRSPGYGIIRFHKQSRDIESEAWPRWADPAIDADAKQYPGWPVTVSIESNYGLEAVGYLVTLAIDGLDDPVVQVLKQSTGEILYTRRIRGNWFRPPVFDASDRYTVSVGNGVTAQDVRVSDLQVVSAADSTLQITWPLDRATTLR